MARCVPRSVWDSIGRRDMWAAQSIHKHGITGAECQAPAWLHVWRFAYAAKWCHQTAWQQRVNVDEHTSQKIVYTGTLGEGETSILPFCLTFTEQKCCALIGPYRWHYFSEFGTLELLVIDFMGKCKWSLVCGYISRVWIQMKVVSLRRLMEVTVYSWSSR